ncbi:MAG TPA: DUF4430 domain-containing protein [Gaiellaceae bacterium]|nr:DUF4430 domain-containing protein [Gaiellaceae bacterium]
MHHRLVAVGLALVLALVLASCGGDDDGGGNAVASENAASVYVTTGCGDEVVVERTDVEAGATGLQALDQVAEIEADGGFVTEIEGVEQNADEQLAWLVYVNGAMAEVGAAEITVAEGDVHWWDLHDWEETCEVPADAQ